MAETLKIIVLEGDETGQELLEQAVRVLDPDLLGVGLELVRYDLSLEKRRETDNEIVHEAARAMREAGFGLKAATVTPEGRDDVGSPNRILREEVDGKVIVRTGRRIPGVVGPVSGVYHPIAVVRMAVDDAYGAKQWREGEGDDEIAYRTEKVTRSTCRAVAEYAFRTAERMGAKVYGGPKWTVSPVYEGMLKEELDAAAARHPDVRVPAGADRRALRRPDLRRRRLTTRDPRIESRRRLPVRPRAADVRLDRRRRVRAALLRRRLRRRGRDGGGAARDRPVADGQGPREPDGDAAGLRLGAARTRRPRATPGAERASRAIYESVLETTATGTKTVDLGGHATTTEFTDAVVDKVRTKVEIWSALGY